MQEDTGLGGRGIDSHTGDDDVNTLVCTVKEPEVPDECVVDDDSGMLLKVSLSLVEGAVKVALHIIQAVEDVPVCTVLTIKEGVEDASPAHMPALVEVVHPSETADMLLTSSRSQGPGCSKQ